MQDPFPGFTDKMSEVKNADGKNVAGQNVDRKNAEWDKMSNGKNADWDET
jgi:hypothetical protein